MISLIKILKEIKIIGGGSNDIVCTKSICLNVLEKNKIDFVRPSSSKFFINPSNIKII